MSKLQTLVNTLADAGMHPGRTVRDSLESAAREGFGCFPPYTPQELIHAAGYLPIGMWGGPTEFKLADRYMQSFCCSILRANLELALQGRYSMLKGIMIPTLCDSLKCLCGNWQVAVPAIPMIGVSYPQNRAQPSGAEQLLGEFGRLRGELEKLTGKPVTDAAIAESFAIYEEWRAAMRRFDELASTRVKTINARVRHYIIKAAQFMDKAVYTARITALSNELAAIPEEKSGARAIFAGIMAEPGGLLDILIENDLAIVGDDLAQESRQFRTLARKEGSVLEKMAGLFLDLKGCSLLYEPDKSRGRMLAALAGERKADVVVFCMMKFCDPEEYDYPICRQDLETAGVKHLYIEIEQQMKSFEQIRTRIQSFMETL
ncbi:MAG: 2-hydroxyacyl-CoA dehydratase family protein [Desulfovibrio sp.]|jgi:benzoyl-CoA reductase/2-hydroxyglutaryl-CoA dehydratase subunit BcrC/BadD/HgdB|nr:2-hydroxyacyl-CoA dehydratase family protein [Desulfovibrio sp.]